MYQPALKPPPSSPKIQGSQDYSPAALTCALIKLFERLVVSDLKAITDPCLDGGPPAVCPQSQQGDRQSHQHGPPLNPPAPGLLRNLCQDPVSGFQLCFQLNHPGSAAGQAAFEAGETRLTPGRSTSVPLKAASFPLCSSPCTRVFSTRQRLHLQSSVYQAPEVGGRHPPH